MGRLDFLKRESGTFCRTVNDVEMAFKIVVCNGASTEDFLSLCDQASTVKITLLGKPTQSAIFTGQEMKDICGGAWPNADNMAYIRRSVIGQMAYPMPKPEIPGGGGGKSFELQGQTRKQGSHKDNTGHK